VCVCVGGGGGSPNSRLLLRRLLDLSKELRSRRLVEAARLFKAADADCIEQAECPQGVDVRSVLGELERDLHVALRPQVVHLVRLDAGHQLAEVSRVSEVAILEKEADCSARGVFAIGKEWMAGQ
jgi:hypothetical protein